MNTSNFIKQYCMYFNKRLCGLLDGVGKEMFCDMSCQFSPSKCRYNTAHNACLLKPEDCDINCPSTGVNND